MAQPGAALLRQTALIPTTVLGPEHDQLEVVTSIPLLFSSLSNEQPLNSIYGSTKCHKNFFKKDH